MIFAGRAAVVLALTLLPLSVAACSSRPLDLTAKVGRSRIVFKGKLTGQPAPNQASFKVLKVFKSDSKNMVSRDQLVIVNGSARCGFSALRPGTRYLVFAKASNSSKGALVAVTTVEEFKKKLVRAIKDALCRTNKGCGKRPRISGLRQVTSVRANQVLNLKCTVSGVPQPKVSWFRENKKLKPNKRLSIKSKRKFSILEINPVRIEDAGRYECRATNSNDQSSSNFTVVAVSPKEPTTTESPTSWISQGQPCPEEFFCLNGGTCAFYPSIQEWSCQCAEDFKGHRCESKSVQTPGISRLWPMATLDATQVQSPSKVWPKGAAARISVDLDETTRMLQRYWGK